MAFVPFLLNELLELPRSMGCVGLSPEGYLIEVQPRHHRRQRHPGWGCRRSQHQAVTPAHSPVDVPALVNDKNEFRVHLDVQQFKPEELKVTVEDNFLVVEGKHEERSDDHGFISRQFKRKYTIPEDVDVNSLGTKLSSDGVLSLSAPKMIKKNEVRELPITFTNEPVRLTSQNQQENKESKSEETMEVTK